jgi:endonuclease/exonuclease/phosphatase family metal-dependent hydrolase
MQRPRHRPRALALLLILSVGLGCAATLNYTDPHGPRFAGTGAVAPEGTEIHLATFNIRYAEECDRAIDLFRADPRLRGAELLFLQEMDEDGTRRIASALSMNYVYYPAALHPKHHRNFGNAILSRWAIAQDRKIILPHLGRTRKSERIAVAATVLVGGRPVRLYCVHLATPFEVGPEGRQEQLRTVLRDAAATTFPVIIAGDFNSSGLGEEAVRQGYQWPTRGLGRTAYLFDYDHVLLRGLSLRDSQSAGVVKENLGASDHRPVWAVVRLDATGDARSHAARNTDSPSCRRTRRPRTMSCFSESEGVDRPYR